MSTVKMIPEEEALGRVKEIYDEIKAQLDIDFVPNLYRVMGRKPEYLAASWNKVKASSRTSTYVRFGARAMSTRAI